MPVDSFGFYTVGLLNKFILYLLCILLLFWRKKNTTRHTFNSQKRLSFCSSPILLASLTPTPTEISATRQLMAVMWRCFPQHSLPAMLGKHSPQHDLLTQACPLCSQVEMYTLQHIPMFVCLSFFPFCAIRCLALQAQHRAWRRLSGTGALRPPLGRPPTKRFVLGEGCFLTPTTKRKQK